MQVIIFICWVNILDDLYDGLDKIFETFVFFCSITFGFTYSTYVFFSSLFPNEACFYVIIIAMFVL